MREIGLIERIESDPNHTKPSPPFKSSCSLSLLRFTHASSILRRSVQSRHYEYPKLPDQDRQIEQLKKCEPLKKSKVKALCLKTMKILVEESNIQRVSSPNESGREKFGFFSFPFFFCFGLFFFFLSFFFSAVCFSFLSLLFPFSDQLGHQTLANPS
jgi:hypothetical protein